MQSTYSVYGTQIHLILDDEFATKYNRAQKAFFQAQLDYKESTGSQWTGMETIKINWTNEEMAAYNNFAELMNMMIELNGGSLAIGEDDLTDDYLVKL